MDGPPKNNPALDYLKAITADDNPDRLTLAGLKLQPMGLLGLPLEKFISHPDNPGQGYKKYPLIDRIEADVRYYFKGDEQLRAISRLREDLRAHKTSGRLTPGETPWGEKELAVFDSQLQARGLWQPPQPKIR